LKATVHEALCSVACWNGKTFS